MVTMKERGQKVRVVRRKFQIRQESSLGDEELEVTRRMNVAPFFPSSSFFPPSQAYIIIRGFYPT